MKKTANLLLALLLMAPPTQLVSAPELGTIKGAVTVSSRPTRGVSLAFVDLASGNIYRATSEETGAFQARVPAGRYVLTTENGAGLAVGRAPSMIAVGAGQVATADVDLAPIAGATVASAAPAIAGLGQNQAPQTEPSPESKPGGTEIKHDEIGCMVAGQFPLIEAGIEPASSVARARVYFKAANSDAWYYVEMTPGEGGFVGKMPRPQLPGPIFYYVEAVTTAATVSTTDLGEARTPEISVIIVADAKDCPGDKKVAAIGPPGEVTVFSAATGAAVAPLGFAAGGVALTLATVLAVFGGAAAIGITTAVVVNNNNTTTVPPTPTTTTTNPPQQTTTTTTTTTTSTTSLKPPTPFR